MPPVVRARRIDDNTKPGQPEEWQVDIADRRYFASYTSNSWGLWEWHYTNRQGRRLLRSGQLAHKILKAINEKRAWV